MKRQNLIQLKIGEGTIIAKRSSFVSLELEFPTHPLTTGNLNIVDLLKITKIARLILIDMNI